MIVDHPWLCCTNRGLSGLPLPQTDLSYGLCDGYAKGRVAIEHRDPDLELRNLPVEVSRHEALAEQFDAVHLRLCAASAVVAGQFSL